MLMLPRVNVADGSAFPPPCDEDWCAICVSADETGAIVRPPARTTTAPASKSKAVSGNKELFRSQFIVKILADFADRTLRGVKLRQGATDSQRIIETPSQKSEDHCRLFRPCRGLRAAE